jgi:hypothetical protein
MDSFSPDFLRAKTGERVMRRFMGFVSLVLVVIALMLLGADMISSLEMRGHIVTRSVASIWDIFDKGGPDAFRVWATSRLPSVLAVAVNGLLGIYGWAIPGVIGVGLAFAFGHKREEA